MQNFNLDLFKNFKISDKSYLENILNKYQKMLCEYNFVNLYSWGDIYKLRWQLVETDFLLIYSETTDSIFMPCKPGLALNDLLNISDNFIAQGKSGNFFFFDIDYVEKNKNLISKYFDLELDKENADYIYKSKKLVELKGNKLNKKKNLVSQFIRNNPNYSTIKLEKKYFDDCFKLAEKWCKDKNCEIIGYTHEISALKRALDKFDELNIDGILILLKDEITAFSVFSKQNHNTADVHFEKYNTEIKGAAQIINWETAKYLSEKYEYINREQDLAIPGLQQAKKSYAPEYMIYTYRLYRKKN